jgi:hypothetical protein
VAAILVGIVLWPTRRQDAPIPQQARHKAPVHEATLAPKVEIAPAVTVRGRPARLKRRRQSAEAARGFIALPGSETLPVPVAPHILRVRISKGELRQFGFEAPPPMMAEFVRADFMLGEDGLARAVRLID